MRCNTCGYDIPDGAMHCPSCGAAVNAAQQPAQYGYGDYQQPAQNSYGSYQQPAQNSYGSYQQPSAPGGVTDSSVLTWGILALVFALQTGFLGIIFGAIGRGKFKTWIATHPGMSSGKVTTGGALAKAGLIAGIVITAVLALCIIIIAAAGTFSYSYYY